ncbi:MAG: rod shape-determining protein MreD [Actinomycetes bacterium]|jgi:rod shape-determining protein MreD|nr:MAG: rod shape-determining protein MreD [Actinomycetota bacterium]
MRIPKAPLVVTVVVLAVVVQTTLLGQLGTFVPDLVVLAVILFTLTRIRPELILLVAFGSGLLVDLVGASLIGLRAVVYTAVAYAAIRTIDYADMGRVVMAIWSAILTFMALALVVIIGTLFGQTNVVGPDIGTRMIVIPLINGLLSTLVAPAFVRIVDRDAGLFRFTP